MTSNFVFPPPPPPPPVSAHDPSSTTHGSSPGNWSSAQGRGRGGGFRGQRGGNRGGRGNTWGASGHARGASNSGYSYQQRHGFSNNNAAPNYSSPAANGFAQTGQQWQPNYGQSNMSTYSPQSSFPQYQAQSYLNSTAQNPAYGQQSYGTRTSSSNQSNQQTNPNATPISMGPPIRMGFKEAGDSAYAVSPNQSFEARNTHYRIDNRPQSSGRGRGQKRQFDEAFRHRDFKPKPLTAPAVPSFGAPLDSTPAMQQKKGQPKKKKKREHNQLGLTPKGEDPEISEDDADEEAKLAASMNNGSGPQPLYSFSFKGKLSTLNSAEDIAAWIAERRKQFPTKLKIAEAKAQKALQQEQAQKAKEQRVKERQEQEEQRKKTAQEKKKKKKRKKPADETSAQAEAEELRKTLEKTQKRLAELEANAKKSHHKASKDKAKTRDLDAVKESATEKPSAATPGSKLLKVEAHRNSISKAVGETKVKRKKHPKPTKPSKTLDLYSDDDGDSISLPSATPSDLEFERQLEDSTSGSSSSSSSSNSDSSPSSSSDSDSDSTTSSALSSAPSRHSSSHKTPAASAPDPKKTTQKFLCRNFVQQGKCQRRNCRYRHRFVDKVEEVKHSGGKKAKGKDWGAVSKEKKMMSWEERPSLYQRLLQQQMEEEEAEAREREKEKRGQEEEQEKIGDDRVLPVENKKDEREHAETIKEEPWPLVSEAEEKAATHVKKNEESRNDLELSEL